MIIEIPADVKDNSLHVVRITSRDERAKEGNWPASRSLDDYRARADFYSYTTHEGDTIDRDGNRVTLTWFADTLGQHVWLYETSYFTRVPCPDHDAYYAQHYVSITDQDGVTTIARPCCGDCTASLRRSARDADMTLNLSEPLRIGQH